MHCDSNIFLTWFIEYTIEGVAKYVKLTESEVTKNTHNWDDNLFYNNHYTLISYYKREIEILNDTISHYRKIIIILTDKSDNS